MNYRPVLFSATRGTKQTELTLQLSTHIFPRIDQLRNKDERSITEKFRFVDKEYGLALISVH